MRRSDRHSALDPPDHVIDRWSLWLKNGGYSGSLQEMEQEYLESKDFDNWSNYLLFLGFDGHINEQKRKFWAFFARTYPARATFAQRVMHYLATTRIGAWYIQKYLGMIGRFAA